VGVKKWLNTIHFHGFRVSPSDMRDCNGKMCL
jgi:hypothetical protein